MVSTAKKDALRASKKSALHSRYLVQSSGWKYSAVTTRITEYHGHVPLPWHCGWGWKIWSQEMNSQMWYKEIKILGEIKMLYWTKNGPAKRSRIWHKCLKSYGNSYFNIYIFQWVFGFWELRILTLLILHHTLWRTTFLLTPFGWYCPILSLHSLLQLECTPTICWERIYHILKLWVMTHDGKFANETRYFSVISWYWITRLILPIAFDHRNWVFWSGNPGCLKQIWFKDISSDTSGSITAKNM